MQCQICKKAGMSGNMVSHSNRHTKTRFKANVHKQTISLNGKVQRVKICSRCLRTLHKPPRVKGKAGHQLEQPSREMVNHSTGIGPTGIGAGWRYSQ